MSITFLNQAKWSQGNHRIRLQTAEEYNFCMLKKVNAIKSEFNALEMKEA
jgi:hypothetical protein